VIRGIKSGKRKEETEQEMVRLMRVMGKSEGIKRIGELKEKNL